MAITWGALRSTSAGHAFRIGYEITQSPTTVTASTSSVTLTCKLYLQTRWAVWDNANTVSWSGSFGSGTLSFPFDTKDTSGWGSANIRLMRTLTRTVTPTPTGPIRSSFSASMTGVDAVPGTATVSGSVNTAAKPLTAPEAIASAAAAYVNDNRIDLSWTRAASHSSTDRPYQSIRVQRWDRTSNVYSTVATLGNVASYSDRSTEAGQRYRYRVGPFNSAGGGGWTYTDSMYTTPAQPASVTASRAADGSVTVSWSRVEGTGYEVVWRYGGGAWLYGQAVTIASAATTSWTHASPEAGEPIQYSVRAIAGPRRSSYRQAAPLQLLTAPLAPTALSPSGGQVVERTASLRVTWRHNSLDTTPQRAYALRYRQTGTTTWRDNSTVYSDVSAATISDAEMTGWDGIDWQVRTWGTSTSVGAWSDIASVQLLDPPAVTITRPADGGVLRSDSTDVEYVVHDPHGDRTSRFTYEIEVVHGADVWRETRTASTSSGAGSLYVTASPLSYTFVDRSVFTLRMRVRSGAGLWSAWAESTFTTQHAPPPTPVVDSADFDPSSGATVLTVSVPGSPTADQSQPVSVQIWRSVLGDDWALLADGLDPASATVLDPLAPIGVEVTYKAVVVSDIGSTAASETVTVTSDSRGWIYLNRGPGWSEMLRVRDNARLTTTIDAPKELVYLAGRTRPVEVVGEHATWKASLDVRLQPNPDGGATLRELLRFCAQAGPVCVRTPKGDLRYVSVSPADGTEERRLESASFDMTELDTPYPTY